MSTLPALTASSRWRWLVGLAGLALLRAIAAGAAAIATRDVFVALSGAPAGFSASWPALAIIAVAGSAIALLRWWEHVEAERLGQNYAAALRTVLFAHVAHLPAGPLAQRRSGGLSLRFVGDLTAVRAWVAQGVARGIAAAVVIPVLAVVLFHLDHRLALGVVIPLGVGLLLMLALGPLLLRAHRRLRRRRARLAVDMTERLPMAPHLRHLGRLDLEQARLGRRSDDMIAASLHRQRRSALLKSLPDACAGVAAAAVLGLALINGLPGALAAGSLAATGMMIAQMRELAGVWDRYCAWQAAKARCAALLALPTVCAPEVCAPERAAVPASPAPLAESTTHRTRATSSGAVAPQALAVRFDAVRHGALGPLSFEVSPGAKIGITGGNGSGKSTLLRLAAGLDVPDHGHVVTDAPALSQGETPPGEAPQQPARVMLLDASSPLLAGSLRKALTLGVRPRPGDAAIRRLARRFGLTPVMARLGGLDGRIAEGGRNLSAGECRRILVARAALADPDLLLLDETDDAMDEAGRRMIRRWLRDSRATVLYVTHDARQWSVLDEVWILEGGGLSRLEDHHAPSSGHTAAADAHHPPAAARALESALAG